MFNYGDGYTLLPFVLVAFFLNPCQTCEIICPKVNSISDSVG